MANVLRLRDRVSARVFPWSEPFDAVVVEFPGGKRVRVVADPPSDDPMVDNEFTLPFAQVERQQAR